MSTILLLLISLVIMLYDIALLMFIRIIKNNFVLYYHNGYRLVIKRLLKCDYMKCIKIMCTLFLSFIYFLYILY